MSGNHHSLYESQSAEEEEATGEWEKNDEFNEHGFQKIYEDAARA
jgi:hypothetical protein